MHALVSRAAYRAAETALPRAVVRENLAASKLAGNRRKNTARAAVGAHTRGGNIELRALGFSVARERQQRHGHSDNLIYIVIARLAQPFGESAPHAEDMALSAQRGYRARDELAHAAVFGRGHADERTVTLAYKLREAAGEKARGALKVFLCVKNALCAARGARGFVGDNACHLSLRCAKKRAGSAGYIGSRREGQRGDFFKRADAGWQTVFIKGSARAKLERLLEALELQAFYVGARGGIG